MYFFWTVIIVTDARQILMEAIRKNIQKVVLEEAKGFALIGGQSVVSWLEEKNPFPPGQTTIIDEKRAGNHSRGMVVLGEEVRVLFFHQIKVSGGGGFNPVTDDSTIRYHSG
jgi:hypothetical protein